MLEKILKIFLVLLEISHFDAHSRAGNDSLKITKVHVLEQVFKKDSGGVRDSVKSKNFEIPSRKKHVFYFFVQYTFVEIGL